jgi:hypothetical protein
VPPISKTAQVLKFFAQQYKAPGVPRKRLVKLAYMADVLARQYLGRPMTALRWIKDHYGPNARDLREYTQELADAELAREYEDEWGVERRYIYLRDLGRPIAFDFSLGENEILAYIAANYLNMELEEFIAGVVKETDPFRAAASQGQPLDMDLINDSQRREVGFDLESVLKAESQESEGTFLTLADFSRAIRTEIASRHAG